MGRSPRFCDGVRHWGYTRARPHLSLSDIKSEHSGGVIRRELAPAECAQRYAGSIVTHAFPWALIAALVGIAPECLGPATAIGAGIASLGCRLVLLRRVERAFGLPPQCYCLVPLRDLLSFAVFASAFFGQSARWKGRRYRFVSDGTLVVAGSSSKP